MSAAREVATILLKCDDPHASMEDRIDCFEAILQEHIINSERDKALEEVALLCEECFPHAIPAKRIRALKGGR